MSTRLNLGFDLVTGPQGFSFRILRKRPGADRPEIIPGMNCPLWFPTRGGAVGCVRDLGRFVMNQLRENGFKVEKFEN